MSDEIKLWPGQEKLAEYVRQCWTDDCPAVAYCGQRGGSTTVARTLSRDFEHAYVVASVLRAAQMVAEGTRLIPVVRHALDAWLDWVEWVGVDTASNGPEPQPCFPKGSLVVLDQPFWLARGETLVRELHACDRNLRVLALGTPGQPWPQSEAIPRFPTWELNPDLTREALADHYRTDEWLARRDYGADPSDLTGTGAPLRNKS